MDTRRLNLRASLAKLLDGQEVAANVAVCLEQMKDLYREVTAIRVHERHRASTDWTQKAQEQAELEQVGNFFIEVQTGKKARTITFIDLVIREKRNQNR